jgi:hypothetical protein
MSKSGREPFEALFERARGDGFTPSELERLWQGVTAAGPGAGGVGGGLTGSGASTSRWASASGAAAKMAALLVVAGAIGMAGLAAKTARAPSAGEPQAKSVQPSPGFEAAPSGAIGPPTVSWDELTRIPDAPATGARPQRATRTALGASPMPEVDAIGGTPPAPEAPAAVPTESTIVSSEPQPSEGALLLRARQSLTSDPSSTLALTDADAHRFPTGPLAPEREVLAIEALTRLHRLPEARARLAIFRARYPQSPHLARLDALVGP